MHILPYLFLTLLILVLPGPDFCQSEPDAKKIIEQAIEHFSDQETGVQLAPGINVFARLAWYF